MRRDVEGDILGRLEKFISTGGKLPPTKDSKINVVELCRLLGLSVNDAQHFHRKSEIKFAVNALASEAGLLGVGERGKPADSGAENLEERISKANDKALAADRAAVERVAANEAIVAQLRDAHARIAQLEAENRSLHARLRLVEDFGMAFDVGAWSGK